LWAFLNVGALPGRRFHEDELTYLVNVASFLGTTVENVSLFEQIKTVQQQWVYTFDSIGDPIMVHDSEGRIVRGNLRLANLLGRDFASVVGRSVSDLFSPRAAHFKVCPYCEGCSGDADAPDPWLQGYFLASNSDFSDPEGRKLGTIHVLKDITERKRAEEKYRNLVASVQEGVFISTLQGRFLDFNVAMMRIVGYENRDELLGVEIAQTLYVNHWIANGSKSFSKSTGPSTISNSKFAARMENSAPSPNRPRPFATRLETSRPIRGSCWM